MGGHHSTQKVSTSSSVVVNATLSQTQSCMAVSDGQNVVNVEGIGNVVSGITQNMTFKVKQDCSSILAAQQNFSAKIADQVSQSLKNQTVALTSWASAGKDKNETNIRNSVATNIDQSMVQTCLAKMSGRNLVNVQGNSNVIQNVVQNMQQSMLSSCMQNTKSAMSTITDISDTVNQHAENIEKNPFAFITDAIQKVVEDLVVAAVIIVVVIALIVLGAKLLTRKAPVTPAAVPVP